MGLFPASGSDESDEWWPATAFGGQTPAGDASSVLMFDGVTSPRPHTAVDYAPAFASFPKDESAFFRPVTAPHPPPGSSPFRSTRPRNESDLCVRTKHMPCTH